MLVMFAESDLVAITTALLSLIGVIFTGYLTLRMALLAKTTASVHTLVNSAMGAQLELHAQTAQTLADRTHDPADIAAAVLAKRLHREHQQNQANENAKP